jgi:hypothetical protein
MVLVFLKKIKIGFDFWNWFGGFKLESIFFWLKIHNQNLDLGYLA